MSRWAAARAAMVRGLVAVMLASSGLHAQDGALVGYVAAKNGERLAYAIVGVEGSGRSQFADDSGRFDFRQLQAGHTVVHVRRLGYVPRQIDVEIHGGAVDTLRVVLDRVAVSLEGVEVKAYPPCTNPGIPTAAADSALASIVNQIRLNAEQYRFLADQYPFVYTTTVERTARIRATGIVGTRSVSQDQYRSTSKAQYKPGDVIRHRGRVSYFEIPTLLDVADNRFVNSHCWYFAGLDTIADEPLVRVDIVASDKLKDADVNGSFYVNRETFQIRRSILHLSRRPDRIENLLDLETRTDFMEVLPSISIIQYVYSVQTMDPEKQGVLSEAYEEHTTIDFKFLKRKPGDQAKP